MATAKWMKKLTKGELAHLAEYSDTGRPTLRSLKFNLEHQKKIDSRCYDCEDIARKLAIPLPSESAIQTQEPVHGCGHMQGRGAA